MAEAPRTPLIALAAVAAIALAGGSGIAAPGDGAGSLLAFGVNDVGQLGTTTNNGTTNANPTPAAVTLPGAIGLPAQMALGEFHTLVETSSGQLYAFGHNYFGPARQRDQQQHEQREP